MSTPNRWQPATRAFPKLYNAHRRIEVSKGLLPAQLDYFKKNPLSDTWRSQVSKDVVDFVDSMEVREQVSETDQRKVLVDEMLPQEKAKLFQNPVRYFSRPHNVPEELRKQVYLPNFSIVLMRTPHLGPRYAQFQVPLWFGKLDLKSYLKNLYEVEVNHIRSFVVHKPATRAPAPTRYTRGKRILQKFEKKMTVELVDPFVWPEEPTETQLNNDDYSKRSFWRSMQTNIEERRKEEAEFQSEPDQNHRRTVAQQAKDLLAGRTTWKPTWKELPSDVKVLQGRRRASATLITPPSGSSSSLSPPQ